MSLLVWKEYDPRTLDVCTFEGFYPSAEPVVEYREANNASSVFISHVSTFILCARA